MDIIETVLKRKTLTFDGNKIVYWSNASPSTPALVFIHGFTCSSALWKDQLPLFKVYNTILIDLPGHGISEAPHVQYSLEYLARAVEAVLAEEEVAPSVLVGFSLGGPVSTMTLRLFSERVAGLIYVDSFFQLPEHYMTESERRGLSKKLEDDAFFEAFIDRFWTQKTTPEIRKEVNSTMLSAAKHMRCNATTMAGVAHAWRSDEIYELPALHLASMMDKVGIDPAWFRHVPKLEMQVWNENGHFLFMEEPEQVNAAVKAFVEAFKLMAASTQ